MGFDWLLEVVFKDDIVSKISYTLPKTFMDPVQRFISRNGSFPIHNVEIQRGIRFSDVEKELIQVWYECYILNMYDNRNRRDRYLPLRCDGTPEELQLIIRTFQQLGENEREMIYLKYIRNIHHYNLRIHCRIPFQITGRYTDVIDEIMRKIS